MAASTDGVEAFLHRFAAIWADNDGAALAADFVDDASLVNPFGERADGRTAVAAMYAEYFAGMLAGTSSTVRVQSVRPVEDRHALADAEQVIRGPDGAVVLTAHLAALLRRDGQAWRFVDSRPSTVAAASA